MDQASTIHSVDTGLIYAVFKFSFSKQYKVKCFNSMVWDDGKQHEDKFLAQLGIVATPSANLMR